MEIGRLSAPAASTKRLAREFYLATSRYGLEAGRPALIALALVPGVFLLYLIPQPQFCPVVANSALRECAGWQDSLRTVFMAVFLQGPPQGVELVGIVSTTLWLLVRVAGLVALASITVAYRHQVSR